jgi:enediyne biosynthesis protein E4
MMADIKLEKIYRTLLAVSVLIALAHCKPPSDQKMFNSLPSSESGISFNNELHEKDSSNSFINEFGYMGGGVGVGDFNNDGLKDLYFTGNQVSGKLYLNLGDNKFREITASAGVGTHSWCTGVSVADINGDGFDDIYVSVFGKNLLERAPNLLFINQGNLTFKEEASAYGLADTGYSTQAVFLDFDRDGDLDMYQTNYLLNGPNANTIFPRDRTGRSAANDRMYRNEMISASPKKRFTDISSEAGIREDGFGLGVVVSDLNRDGWPDIYVANDFVSNDLMWLNNRNGSFNNRIADAVQHQSYSSMGAEAADLNNDLLTDIVTLDMLPETNLRKKTSFSMMNYERYQAERSMGYEPSFMRNVLQLNNGNLFNDSLDVPSFSEIGQYAGIAATDWSWSVLAADFDNDGWKDLHITNGIGRDFINADFLEFSNALLTGPKPRDEQQKLIRGKLAELDHVKLPNYLFVNNRNYGFRDASDSSGINEPSMSNGAAYADLDNDGDLDLVVNNINSGASILINNTNSPGSAIKNHYIRCRITGDSLNRRGFGSRVTVFAGGMVQMQEQNPVRGYFSSVDQDLLFGLGSASKID